MNELPMMDPTTDRPERCSPGRNFGNRLVVLFLILWLASTAVLGWQEHEIGKKASKGESHATCVVQDRGLKANAHLLRAMLDVEALIPYTPAARSHPLIVASLQAEVEAYTSLEALQPMERKC